jgi:hypothetical protein
VKVARRGGGGRRRRLPTAHGPLMGDDTGIAAVYCGEAEVRGCPFDRLPSDVGAVPEETTLIVRRAVLSLLALLLLAWPRAATAQDATPAAADGAPLDLAAMALAPDDVPDGYFDDYSEWWVPAGPFADLVLGGGPVPAGLKRVYQTFYVEPEGGTVIHCYLYEFASPDAAAAGTAVVEGALRPPLPEGTVVGPTRAPGPELGDGRAETTAVTYDTWAAGGPRADVVAVSFRRDRLVAGVAVERYTDPPGEGTAVAEAATPTASDPAQEQLATALAMTLNERITMALADQVPAGTDPELAALVLPLDQLADGPTPVFGGYKAGADLLRCGICGEENALLPFADHVVDGFNRAIILGPLVDGEPQPPIVSLAVATFDAPESASAALAAIRQAPNDRPTAGPFPRGNKTLAADPEIPGARTALAFEAIFNEESPDAPADSAGVDFVVGDRLVSVDVLGGLSAEEALSAAVDLATQQAACLVADGPCESVELPPTLANAAGA